MAKQYAMVHRLSSGQTIHGLLKLYNSYHINDGELKLLNSLYIKLNSETVQYVGMDTYVPILKQYLDNFDKNDLELVKY